MKTQTKTITPIQNTHQTIPETTSLIHTQNKICFSWKDLKPIKQKLDNLFDIDSNHSIDNTVSINGEINEEQTKELHDILLSMKPWRKGPFKFFDIDIQSEWNSYIKYNIIKNHLDIENKIVADIGCNNGYYMFKMLELNPREIIGFDPSCRCYLQFHIANHFIKADKIDYKLLGVDDVYEFAVQNKKFFDSILFLGVLYHRSDPISCLKTIYKSLNKNGTLIIDTLIIDGEEDVCLFPKERYAKMKNIYFIPTINALKNMLHRAKFTDIEVIEIIQTTNKEQRATKWIGTESLDDFIDKKTNKTTEGYQLPTRAYLKCKKE